VHPTISAYVKSVARPLHFDDQPPAASTPPPILGEHTVEVFDDWLGWTRKDVCLQKAPSAMPR